MYIHNTALNMKFSFTNIIHLVTTKYITKYITIVTYKDLLMIIIFIFTTFLIVLHSFKIAYVNIRKINKLEYLLCLTFSIYANICNTSIASLLSGVLLGKRMQNKGQ